MRIQILIPVLLILFAARAAFAEEVTITFEGSVITVTGELVGIVATDDVVTGSITYESTTSGVFTPSPNPTFVRSEMLYTGAVTGMEFTLTGDTVSGTAGDVEIFDATEMLAGQDSWEVTTAPSSGTLGGTTPTSFFFNPSYNYLAYTLTSGDPVPAPLPFAASEFNQFSLATSGGGTAYGSITNFDVSATAAAAVPALDAWASLALMASLSGAARNLKRRWRRRD